MEQMNQENYRTAAELWQKLRDHYPYSRFALLAELKMSDALYLSTQYADAAEAYLAFEQLHPNNEAVPYAIHQQGMCHYQMMKGAERDQTPAVKTIQTFARLRERFPTSKYAAMALPRLTEAQASLAGHEFQVANFYYQLGHYQAALGRFVSLIKNYPDTGYHAQALGYIKICQEKIAALKADGDSSQPEGPPVDFSMPETPGPEIIVQPPELEEQPLKPSEKKEKEKKEKRYKRPTIRATSSGN
jgi:outer membrane protein assembly factor BamD